MRMLEAHGKSEPVAILRREYRARAAGGAEAPTDAGSLAGLQGRAVAAQRRALQGLRRSSTIGDDAFHAIEEELDIIELTANPRVRALDGPEQPSAEPSASAQ
jgi:CPA1 family monovalent cation:H+ antiporter